jgi:hypothetical protein
MIDLREVAFAMIETSKQWMVEQGRVPPAALVVGVDDNLAVEFRTDSTHELLLSIERLQKAAREHRALAVMLALQTKFVEIVAGEEDGIGSADCLVLMCRSMGSPDWTIVLPFTQDERTVSFGKMQELHDQFRPNNRLILDW